MNQYIVIEGNIGAGKTTLAKRLSEHLNAQLLLEAFENNSFLPEFYKDPERYAFPLELSFLADRFTQMQKVDFHQFIVADYHISKSFVFAKHNLNDSEYQLFERMYTIMFEKLPTPDVMLFLDNKTDTLLKNIRNRNRSYEQSITPDYLDAISQSYRLMLNELKDIPILIIQTDDHEFITDNSSFNKVLTLVGSNHKPGVHHFDLHAL